MNIFKKRETLKETIPFAAIMVALNAIVCALIAFLPLFGYIVSIIFPLISTVFCLYTRKRFYPLYLVCSLLIGILLSLYDTSGNVIFTLFPALIEGFIFSLLIKKGISGRYIFFVNTVVLFLCKTITIPLINFIYSTDIISNILKLINLDGSEIIKLLLPSIIYLICCAEMVIIYLITNEELKKFKCIIPSNNSYRTLFDVATLIFVILAKIFYALNIKNISYLLILFGIVLAIVLVFDRKICLLFSPLSLVISWILFIIFIQKNPAENGIIVFSTIPFFIVIIDVIYSIIKNNKEKKNDQVS